MFLAIKKLFRKVLSKIIKKFSETKTGRFVYEQVISHCMTSTIAINHQGLEMRFSVPNQLNYFRATSFSNKEPETLEWIDQFPEKCVFWDIGANVGLYTVYAALRKKCHVVAFEPSVFNLELLIRNLHLNRLHQQVTLLPLALSDKMGSNLLRMTSTEWGGGTFDIWRRCGLGWAIHSGGLCFLYLWIEHGSSRGGPKHARAGLHQDGRGWH